MRASHRGGGWGGERIDPNIEPRSGEVWGVGGYSLYEVGHLSGTPGGLLSL